MEQFAQPQPEQGAARCQKQIFAENLTGRFFRIEAEDFDCCDFPDSFRDIDIGQIVDDNKSQRAGGKNQ